MKNQFHDNENITMKKAALLICSYLLVTQTTFANEEAKMANTFNRLIAKSRLKPEEIGIYVLDQNKPIVEINADKLMVPASLSKILTGGAILKKMPLNLQFMTELKSDAQVEGNTLKGDLCFVGGGDPSFVSEKMWVLVNNFTRTGITKIAGNIIVDSSRFDNELYDKGRDSVRVDRAYDAPVSASSFNWNSVNVYVRPGKKANDPAQVFVDPPSPYFSLENKATTAEKSDVKSISVSRVQNGQSDKITVKGQISKDAEEMVTYKSITNPNLWTGTHLIEFLKQRNIAVEGKVVVADCKSQKVLSSVESKKIIEMVSDMLKFSNNYVAEMLVKNLGTFSDKFQKNQKNASMEDGINIVKKYLEEIGFKKNQYEFSNVSGLNRKNQLSAKQISLVLQNIKNDFTIFPEFMAGLPIAGIDGTLKNRLKAEEKYNLIRAKTGHLDGVTGLAGYIGRDTESPLIFVFMFNGPIEKGYDARVLFDNLSKELVNY